MADSNEAQLLSDLLRDIAREDARVNAAHLEARVIEAAYEGTSLRLKRDTMHERMRTWAVAAAAAVACAVLLMPLAPWLNTQFAEHNDALKVDATEEAVAEESNADVRVDSNGPAKGNGPAKASGPPQTGDDILLRRPAGIAKSATQSADDQVIADRSPIAPITQSPLTQSLDEFVPLMPMTERELTGPFQLVRVQMPRASLGVLRSPLEPPNELIEADVLLGEDGMARAIRVSKSGSVYPWRSR